MSARASKFLRQVAPKLDGFAHKGQGGRIGVLGGSKDYTGAPYYSGMAALRVGAELCTVFTESSAANAMKTYSPELMVTPIYSWSNLSARSQHAGVTSMVELVKAMLPRLHVLVIGPGLGRNKIVMEACGKIVMEAKKAGLPIVIDADGLFMVTENPALVQGYKKLVLTPNVREYQNLALKVTGDKEAEVAALSSALGGVTILKKGPIDRISNTTVSTFCEEKGTPRRCGGLGDFLCGTVGTLLSWTDRNAELNDETIVEACFAACVLVRHACLSTFKQHKRAMTAPDVLAFVGPVFEEFCPAEGS
eukprot:m.80656 g.80656  ORF g.80656 m.80656 type:complete len:306 (-) comp12774_c0_seq2:1083-2000(-)